MSPSLCRCASALLVGLLVAGGVVAPVAAQPIRAVVDSTASVIHYTGSAPLHDWTGTSRQVQGQVVLDPSRPDSSRAVLRVPVASFDSGNNRRDRGMRDVTAAETHPFVTFRGTAFTPVVWGRGAAGYRGTWAVSGTLTFHGQTHPVADTVRVDVAADSVRVRAQFPVSLTQFGVERPGFMGFTVADTIRIDAHLAGPRVADSPGTAQ